MTTFRLDPAGAEPFDLAWAALDAFTLWRQAGRVAVAVEAAQGETVRRALALHGVGVREDGGEPAIPSGLLRALGTGLRPVALAPGELDLLRISVLPLAVATALALARPHPRWPIGAVRRDRARALLRGSDLVFVVERQAWCGRQTLAAAQRSLRPLLFDRGAPPRAARVRASDGAISAWVRG